MTPETCPHCDAEVPRGAKSCPECGADAETGWSDSASADRLGIPDENFDYDKFIKQEFGPSKVKPREIHWLWWATALVMLGVMLYFFLGR